MSKPIIDIIVPVWNGPVETRACLVNLIRHSPGARLILVNNGGERETEALLEEFAEGLDERALLISSPINLGFVRGVNQGLARAEAELAAVVRNSTLVSDGWLEPLLELARARPAVGVIVPRLVTSLPKKRVHSPPATTETSHGDFAAMLIRKGLHQRIGGFDEELDGGIWCLKDYARRGLREGFLTCAVEGSPVIVRDDPVLGSTARREAILRRSMAAYAERWGEERTFSVHFPKGTDLDAVRRKFAVLLRGARQGHSFTVFVFPATYRELVRNGDGTLHRNIRLARLPRLFAGRWVATALASLRRGAPGLVSVAGGETDHSPVGGERIPFDELEQLIDATETEQYEGCSPLHEYGQNQ